MTPVAYHRFHLFLSSTVLCSYFCFYVADVFLCTFIRYCASIKGGGCAEELAKWVKNGHPDKDMFGYDIRFV